MVNDLGPMFGTRPIKGPILVAYTEISRCKFYFIGKDHMKNGTHDKNIDMHVVEQLRKYNEGHRVRCYSELSYREIESYVSQFQQRSGDGPKVYQAQSPLYAYAWYLTQNMFSSDKHAAVLCDMRKWAPYDVYTIITAPYLIAMELYGDDFYKHLSSVMTLAKKTQAKLISEDAARSDIIPITKTPGECHDMVIGHAHLAAKKLFKMHLIHARTALRGDGNEVDQLEGRYDSHERARGDRHACQKPHPEQ